MIDAARTYHDGTAKQWSGLVLYFSRWASLARWAQVGHLNREVEYYRQLGQALGGVTWVTHGAEEDLKIAEDLKGIHVFSNVDRLPDRQYAAKVGREIHQNRASLRVLKTNQLSGAYEASLACRGTGIPFILRCGNVRNYWIYQPKGIPKIAEWLRLQKALKAARAIIVPTEEEATYARRRFLIPRSKIRILPNFVQTDLFRPAAMAKQKGLLGFVGSLKPAKNLQALVRAAAGLPDVRLRLIGEGREKKMLAGLADDLSVPIEFVPYQSNEVLPRHLNECEIFVFPSLREGHPKALIEAMACGLPVVTTPVYGIRRLISHRVNGYLCAGTSVEAIRKGITDVLKDEPLRKAMGLMARKFVVDHFDMPVILEKELQIYRELNCLV